MKSPHERDESGHSPPRADVLAALDAMDGSGQIAPSVFTAAEVAAELGESTVAVERTLARLKHERRVERLDLGRRSRAWKRWTGYREIRSPG